ncbi:glycerate kinase [Enterococcus hulanensis]|uniref:Glycerate kinase n=1 Tax=Enterococcus hulanensis TaxID=2559929 RepID=A0ABU3EZD7_9ENTE|nr:glycerate kinase [Enterococcus hulanensis]MDT2600244.1 glycerate kinase [Enterococcus hulanensis]MDT2609057.1 glycerate kinase [Enterococcus hulanensis]MDT2616901.1 glycerate kinase [Enterococcus hulanensis]MDT2628579.1 glycerate kinase [Enterococcus hulanensis]MDT2655919.1 glycerate kinase [Enterococcus hulanensis]
MKILVAIDSFKGSATSKEINAAVSQGIKNLAPEVHIETLSVADGGEGTSAAFHENGQGKLMQINALDLFDRPVQANYCLIDGKTAVVEVAETAGIYYLNKEYESNQASSFGFGKMLHSIAIENPQIEKFLIGLGGSGINDAGIGMMQALGVSFKKSDGSEIGRGTTDIINITEIDDSGLDNVLKDKEIILLSDVKISLIGPNGATFVFGSQKGIEDLAKVDQALAHYAKKLYEKFGIDYSNTAGTGAAGGLGISFLHFFNSHFVSGGEYIMEKIGMEEKMRDVDLVITGEGKMDRQSAYGKLPTIITHLAKKQNKIVIAVVGDATEVHQDNYPTEIDLVLSLSRGPITLRESILQTKKLAEYTGEDIIRIMNLNSRLK